MRRLVQKIWNLVRNRQHPTKHHRRPSSLRRWRPFLEALEDRLTPAASGFTNTAPAVLTGFVYADTNNNNVPDPGEMLLPGANVTLTGTTNQGAAVRVNTTTDANGVFTFLQVQPGTYSLTRGALSAFVDGQGGAGNLGGTAGISTISGITIAEGQAAVNYNLPVRGLIAADISLRQFLATPPPASVFLPPAGAGLIAADNSVQPSSAATPGTSSLAGSVLNVTNNQAISGVQIGLTGIDNTGRAILLTTPTDANGAYKFANLQAGTYTLNVLSQPVGFSANPPTVGSVGGTPSGFIFRNDQIIDITVGAGVAGSGYTFNELPALAPAPGIGPVITARLADDTAGPAATGAVIANGTTQLTSDGITSDPSIQGSIVSTLPITGFSAGIAAGSLTAPPANLGFVSILTQLTPGGGFFLNTALIEQLARGSLPNGTYTLFLQASDALGRASISHVTFTLDTKPAALSNFQIQGGTTANSITATSGAVTFQGQITPGFTSPSGGVEVDLLQGGTLIAKTQVATPSAGPLSFTLSQTTSSNPITLNPGVNTFTVLVTDIAGNVTRLDTFFVFNQITATNTSGNPIKVVPAAAVPESLTHSGAALNVDLSSPTLFTDADFSNSQVVMNTSAGPIHLQLTDGQDPQTVANFFNYINSGAYTNDFFQRNGADELPPLSVLQAGGFTFNPSTSTITPITPNALIPDEANANQHNVTGTIAMARQTAANTASSEFFLNFGDNSQALDFNSISNPAGFAVFGQVVSGADQRVLNTLAAIPVQNQSAFNSAFNVLPLQNYNGTKFPTDTTAANYALIKNVQAVQPRTDQLTFALPATGANSNPSVVTAAITNDQLVLTPTATAGTSTITVQVTDTYGFTQQVQFLVTVA